MEYSIKYLNKKKVNNIFPIVINNTSGYNITSILTTSYIFIWPWGYDN